MKTCLRSLVLCLLLWAASPVCGQGQQDTLEMPDPRPHVSEVVFYTGVPFQMITYHNFSYLPRELMVGMISLGAYVPVVRSGTDVSVGFQPEATYSQSMTLEKVYALDASAYLTARFGAANQSGTLARKGLAAGVGPDLFCYMNHGNGPSLREIRPAVFLEGNILIFRRQLFVRYSSNFTSGFFTKQTVMVGYLLQQGLRN